MTIPTLDFPGTKPLVSLIDAERALWRIVEPIDLVATPSPPFARGRSHQARLKDGTWRWVRWETDRERAERILRGTKAAAALDPRDEWKLLERELRAMGLDPQACFSWESEASLLIAADDETARWLDKRRALRGLLRDGFRVLKPMSRPAGESVVPMPITNGSDWSAIVGDETVKLEGVGIDAVVAVEVEGLSGDDVITKRLDVFVAVEGLLSLLEGGGATGPADTNNDAPTGGAKRERLKPGRKRASWKAFLRSDVNALFDGDCFQYSENGPGYGAVIDTLKNPPDVDLSGSYEESAGYITIEDAVNGVELCKIQRETLTRELREILSPKRT